MLLVSDDLSPTIGLHLERPVNESIQRQEEHAFLFPYLFIFSIIFFPHYLLSPFVFLILVFILELVVLG
jgi:hypothetical protein